MHRYANKLAVLLLFPVACLAQGGIIGGSGRIGGNAQIGSTASSATTVTYATGILCNGSGTSGCFWSSGNPSAGEAVVILTFDTVGTVITSVCDGTSGGCSGSSTYSSETAYTNSGFQSQIFYTCNYAGASGSGGQVSFTTSSGTIAEVVGIAGTGNRTSSCTDGYGKNQSTTGTAYSSGSVGPTTNANDLFIGAFTNVAGSGCTAGTDGQGNTMTVVEDASHEACIEYFNETSTNTYNASLTGGSAAWNGEGIAIR